jgi:hypothetical protein
VSKGEADRIMRSQRSYFGGHIIPRSTGTVDPYKSWLARIASAQSSTDKEGGRDSCIRCRVKEGVRPRTRSHGVIYAERGGESVG